MTTERQLAANRANAKRSTGPKTKRGRYASSRNALRHGLASSAISGLNPIDIDSLAQALAEQGAGEAQIEGARQAARFHVELSRVRAVRATLLASFEPKGCNLEYLSQLVALERYERAARGRRRHAARSL